MCYAATRLPLYFCLLLRLLPLYPPAQPAIAPASGRRVERFGLGVLASALAECDHDVAHEGVAHIVIHAVEQSLAAVHHPARRIARLTEHGANTGSAGL